MIVSKAEAVGLEPTSENHSPPVFKTGPSSGRMTSVRHGRSCLYRQLWFSGFVERDRSHSIQSGCAAVAGAGIEPTSRRSERRILPLNDPARLVCPETPSFARCSSVLETTLIHAAAGTGTARRVVHLWRSCGGRNRTCGRVVQSHAFLPAETTPHR